MTTMDRALDDEIPVLAPRAEVGSPPGEPKLAANQPPASAQPAPPAPPVAAPPKPSKKPLVLGVVALALATAGGAYYLTHAGRENTDDAQVDADVVGVTARTSGFVTKVNFTDNAAVKAGDLLVELDDAPAKARLAQAEASLASASAAADAADADVKLAEVNATASKSVATASLRTASAGVTATRDQIREAEARVTAAESRLAQATADEARAAQLGSSGALSASALEQARTEKDTANASAVEARAHLASVRSGASQAAGHVQEASAKVEQTRDVTTVVAEAVARAKGAHARVDELTALRDLAKLDLSYTKVYAPQAGTVSKKNVSVGQTVSAGAPFAQLISHEAGGLWVTGNFKETQVHAMRKGQPAHIEVDGLPGVTLTGEIESFSAATGSRFALLPPDNATGNFTKVVQRVPVRIHLKTVPENVLLLPGMNVDLTVDTRSR
jgi:membrane fusion protein, multidrug efflux system